MSKSKHPITTERAKLVVENGPGFDRDLLIAYVQRALQSAFDEGVQLGRIEERESALRTILAFQEGNEQRARGAANSARNDLNAVLDALGKPRVLPP